MAKMSKVFLRASYNVHSTNSLICCSNTTTECEMVNGEHANTRIRTQHIVQVRSNNFNRTTIRLCVCAFNGSTKFRRVFFVSSMAIIDRKEKRWARENEREKVRIISREVEDKMVHFIIIMPLANSLKFTHTKVISE